jgi:predicted glycogen debranching enzyme
MNRSLPRDIRFGREVCNDLVQAERREWWLANGLGGYAAGTLAGTLTRRYHGLLVAALQPPFGRTLVFAKADATLIRGDGRHELHANRWTGGPVQPLGHLRIESFHLDGRLPVWRYAIGDLHLEHRIWMEPRANTTYAAWRLSPAHGGNPGSARPEQPRLSVRLLVNARDHHGETRPGDIDPSVTQSDEELRVSLPSGATLRFRSRLGQFRSDKTWVQGFDLPAERARGLPDQDNHLCAGVVDLPLVPGQWAGLVASLEADPSPDLGKALARVLRRDDRRLRQARRTPALASAPAWIDQLVLAADSFLIEPMLPERRPAASVIAGYPWFDAWGRDTFIALPGLTLCTRRHDQARRILEGWAPFLDAGLLPNFFPEGGAPPAYNAADAPLWYLEAWRTYLEAGHGRAALTRHWPALAGIAGHYARGTRQGIGLDPADGLIRAGTADTQLTWMDACVAGRPVTPRTGKAVELNALWYNALMALAGFARLLDRDPEPFAQLAARAREGFRRFLRADGLGLVDVLDGPQGNDARVRPNQILAVSLAHSPLDPSGQAAVVRVVGERLLTSYGLRTLDPAEAEYRPRCEGNVANRDAAYHQGPAWVWLLPHYALALHRVTGDPGYAQSLLSPLADHLADAGLGTISELFDAEPPHRPRGAPSQAWSVACALDAWCRLERAKWARGRTDPDGGLDPASGDRKLPRAEVRRLGGRSRAR